MKKQLLFISDTPPNDSTASAVVFYRHFQLLEKSGYGINIILFPQQKAMNFPSTWNIRYLPIRRRWYPPYRPNGLLKWIRFFILFCESWKFIRNVKPALVIGFLHGVYYSGLAAFVAKFIRRPLAMFYHDRTENLLYDTNPRMKRIAYRHNSIVLDKATVVWTVSPQLIYPEIKWAQKFKVVYPIPEKIALKAVWKDTFANQPVIGYAGTLYNEVVDSMAIVAKQLMNVGGSLLLMTELAKNVKTLTYKYGNVKSATPRATTSEACEYFIENASAFIVAYPETIDVMPWIDSCFPSKFTQFVQTGLPILVIAPREAAISKWCIANNWLGYTDSYKNSKLLLTKLMDKVSWSSMAAQSVAASLEAFSQHTIHRLVESDVENLIRDLKN